MLKIAPLLLSIFIAFFFTACNAMLAKMSQRSFSGANSYENSSVQIKLLNIQKQWQNTPYRLGEVSVKGADCSGFIQSVFKEHFQTTIPRTTKTQLQGGKKVTKNELESGDILFFRTGRGPNGLHTGIYVANDEFIHLSTSGGVKKVSFNLSYWKSKFIGARRYLR